MISSEDTDGYSIVHDHLRWQGLITSLFNLLKPAIL